MTVKWLIERKIQRGDDPDRLAEIVREKGMECIRVEYVPFSQSFLAIENGKPKRLLASNMPYLDGDCVVVIGTLNVCQLLMNPKRWTPTAWFDLEQFRCVSYYRHWKDFLLQEDYAFYHWKELRQNKEKIYSALGADGCIFIKPDENLKTFSGSVVPADEFEHWADMNQDCYEIAPDVGIVVARPVGIKKEWRFIVCDKEVITGSLYKEDGKVKYEAGFPPEAKEVADQIAALEWQPDSVYALDICSSGDKFYVLECGPFNGAGLYQCDLEVIVEKVGALAIKEWQSKNK